MRAASRPTAYLDLDGCLIDSRIPIGLAIERVLAELGTEALIPGELDGCIGPPIVDGFRGLLRARKIDVSVAEHAVAIYRRHYGPISLQHTTLVPGIAAALADLVKRADAVIVTSKPRHFAEPIVDHLGIRNRVVAVVGPGLDALEEGKVETLRRAMLERLRTAADAMVGDRHHDIEAGRAHGMQTIGVTWGIGSHRELAEAGAGRIVDRPAELLACFPIPACDERKGKRRRSRG